jgi:signal transduction histidine kinase
VIAWRRSAALRLSIAYSACLAIGVVVLGAVTFWSMHIAFQRQIDAALEEEAATLSREYRGGGIAELREAITAREAIKLPQRPLYALYDARGMHIAGSLVAREPLPGSADIRFTDPKEGPDWARAVTVNLGNGLRIVVAADREQIETIDQTLITAFSIAFVGVLALGMGGALLFAKLLRDRLGRLAASAEAISAGAVSARMPVGRRGDEFDTLATSLNHMLIRIEALIESLRQVSGAIAHDLRTPLTRLRQRLELAVDAANNDRAQELTASALVQVDEVLSLFAAILHVSEVESGVMLPVARIDLSALTAEIAESYEPAVRAGGRSLDWSLEPTVIVSGTRGLLAQALSNLVENAIQHTPPGSYLHIGLKQDAQGVELSVSDNGPGIPAVDSARALRRFERLDPTRAGPGFGLGLTLVDAVARRHGGRLQLSDAGPGLIASIHLPFDDRSSQA